MIKPLLVIASPDDRMATMLVLKLLQQLGDQAVYEVFTDEKLFREYMNVTRSVDVLIVSDHWSFTRSDEQRIRCEIGLSGDGNAAAIAETAVKYCRDRMNAWKEGTRILMVYSPVGGSGKTSLSLGLAENLSRMGHKVLYIDAEYLQTFQFWLGEEEALVGNGLLAGEETLDYWRDIQPLTRNRGFDYLLPFGESLADMKLDYTIFWHIVLCAKQSGVYDYIVLDTDSSWNSSKESLAALSDQVLILGDEREDSCFKSDRLKERIASEEAKYLFICNEYPPLKTGSGRGELYDGRIGFAQGKPFGSLPEVEQLACRFV